MKQLVSIPFVELYSIITQTIELVAAQEWCAPSVAPTAVLGSCVSNSRYLNGHFIA